MFKHSLRADRLVGGVGNLQIMHDVGIGLHKIRHLKLHAKTLLADKSRAIVGSINLSPGSLDSRRELAIRLEEHEIVNRLVKVVQEDWENSRPLGSPLCPPLPSEAPSIRRKRPDKDEVVTFLEATGLQAKRTRVHTAAIIRQPRRAGARLDP